MDVKTLEMETATGEKINLYDLVKSATIDAQKDAGFPFDESGKFDTSAFKTDVKSEAEVKKSNLDTAAMFIKGLVLPSELKNSPDYQYKAIDSQSGSFGNVVPTALYDRIIEQSKKWQIVRKYAFVFSMTGKLDVPQEGTAVTAYWVGENVAITESNPTLGKATLDDHGLAALIKVPWKLMRTSSQNIVDFVSQLAAKAITQKEESAFVDGDGSSKPLGFRNTPSVGSIAQAGANLAYSDIVALYFLLPQPYRSNAQFVTSGNGAQLVYTLKDSQNRPLFGPGQAMDTMFGRPLLETADIPANLGAGTNETEIWFAELFNYWIKDGSEIEMATQDVIENLQTKVVVFKYVDGRVVNKDGFRKLTGVK